LTLRRYLTKNRLAIVNELLKGGLIFLMDLSIISIIFLLMSFLVIKGPIPSGIVIPDKNFIMSNTVIGYISQFNIFSSLEYLPIYYVHLSAKDDFLLLLAIGLFCGGLAGIKAIRNILSLLPATSKILITTLPWASLIVLIGFPFNIYNLRNLTASQYVAPAVQIFFMYDVIAYMLLFLLLDRNRYRYLLLMFLFLLLINYQFFYGSLLLVSILLSLLMIGNLKSHLMALKKVLLTVITVILATLFAVFFGVSLSKSAPSSKPVLPQLSLGVNTNFHTYLIFQSLPPSYTLYVSNALAHFSPMWLLTRWILSNYNYGSVSLLYIILVDIFGVLPLFILGYKIKIQYKLFTLTYLLIILVQILLGPQISMFFASIPNEYSQIVSYVFDAPMVFEPILQVLIAILSPIFLLMTLGKVKKKIGLIPLLGLILISLTSVSVLYATEIPINSVASASSQSPSVVAAENIDKFLSSEGFPLTYFELLNNTYADSVALYQYPESQFSLGGYYVTYLYYALGYTLLYPGFLGVRSTIGKPFLVDVLLSNLNFSYLATDRPALARMYNSSGLFSIIYHDSGFYVLKIKKIEVSNSTFLLSTSVREYLSFVNKTGYSPIWLNQPYITNISYLNDLIATGNHIVVPSYFTVYELFTFVQDKVVIVPSLYCSNSWFANRWETGYFDDRPQETWGQNIGVLGNYSFQNDISPNYGVVYTEQSQSALKIYSGVRPGDYILLARVLKSPIGGELEFLTNGVPLYVNTSSSNNSFFQFVYLGNISAYNGKLQITLINIKGFNAINVIYAVPSSTFQQYMAILMELYSNFTYSNII